MPTWPKQPKQAVPTVGAGPGHSQRHTQPGWAQRWEGGRREPCGWPASLQSYRWPEIPGMTSISGSPKANSPLGLETCVYSQQFLVILTSNLNRIPNRSWLSMCRSGSLAKIEKPSWSWDLWGRSNNKTGPRASRTALHLSLEQVPLMTSLNQSDSTLRYSSGRRENIYTQRLGDIYWTFTHNCPKPEVTQMPISKL